jgi:N-methylhydantoinase A/oxoprolinase/acetone carboxylase beta subunit
MVRVTAQSEGVLAGRAGSAVEPATPSVSAGRAPLVTVDIDVGGTFTDGFYSAGSRTATVKVDTTPHDLTICFWACLEAGAERLQYDSVRALLSDVRVVRFSTTVGTNTILQSRGPRLGLLVSRGQETSVYEPNRRPSPLLLLRFVTPQLVVGIADSPAGDDGPPIDDAVIRQTIIRLLRMGARQIAVSLAGAGRDDRQERRVREIVRQYYPKHFLGSVPLLLSSQVRPRLDDFTRTNVTVINAYLHEGLATALYRAEDRLRAEGYPRPLLITHASGGVARVAKTRAVDTYSSGPVAGLFGCARFAARYRLPLVATVDVGGTSTDIGILHRAAPRYSFRSAIAGVPVDLPSYQVDSIAAGGGTIAGVDGERLILGPDSAGALPGPAAYGLGGAQATVTDACLVLGYLDPAFFLGGRRRLDLDAARRAIELNVGRPLRISVEEAARRIVEGLEIMIADGIRRFAGVDREALVLFVFGGAGGLFAAGLSARLAAAAYVFRHGSVLNAWGSSSMDVAHVYERATSVVASGESAERLGTLLDELAARARRDMRGEGFAAEGLMFRLELEITGGAEPLLLGESLDGGWDVTVARALGRDGIAGQVTAVRLIATAPVPHATMVEHAPGSSDPSGARKGQRSIHVAGKSLESPVYDAERLAAGNVVDGPALIETAETTVLLPSGFRLQVDQLLTGVIRPRIGIHP